MIRQAAVLLIFAVLAAFAGAQGTPAALTASQQQQLFQKNRSMIETLVDSSLKISKSGSEYTERARSYSDVVKQLQKELDKAAVDADVSRLAELGQHLNTVLGQGLVPSLKVANGQIGADGTGRDKLIDIRDLSVLIVDSLQSKVRDRWADSPEVRELIEKLEKTKKDLNSSVAP